MKVRANRKALAEVVTWVSQAIAKNPPAPVLSGMLLRAQDGRLTLRGFDYDVSHQAHLDVDVVTEGECLVSAAFLRGIVTALRGVSIELVLDGGRLSLTCGSATYGTNVMLSDDYPALPAQPTTVATVDGDELIRAIATSRPPVDDNAIQEGLQGMRLEASKGRLTVIGFRAEVGIISELSCDPHEPFAITAPVRSLEPAARGMSGEVAIGLQDGVLGLSDQNRSVTMRTFTADYAPWRRVVRDPSTDAFEALVDVDELIEVVKRAGSLSDDGRVPLIVTFDADQVQVEVSADERGGGCEQIPTQLSDDTVSDRPLAFIPRYLLEALGAMPPGLVRLGIGSVSPLRVVMVRPQDRRDVFSMVMPRRLPEAYR